MSVNLWKIKDMLSYAHQLYPLLDGSDDAYRKKIRRFLAEKGYVVPDTTSGKYSFRLPESLAKYVIGIELREYFEKNIDPRKSDEFFQKRDVELNGGGDEQDDYIDDDLDEKLLKEKESSYEDLWEMDFDFTPMTAEEYETAFYISDEHWEKFEVKLLKHEGYVPGCWDDPKNRAKWKRAQKNVKNEKDFWRQRYYEAHKFLPLELKLLGLNYIMLKQLIRQSYCFDEDKFLEDMQEWYRLIRFDYIVDRYRKGFSEMNNRVRNPGNYFTKK